MEAVGFSEVVGVLGALWMSLESMSSIKLKVERSLLQVSMAPGVAYRV